MMAQTGVGSERRLVGLCALVGRDGFGELGIYCYPSSHAGIEAVRWVMGNFGLSDEEAEALDYSSDAVLDMPWCVMTTPRHSRVQMPPTCVVVHPVKGREEADSMVDAGLAKWRPDIAPEPWGPSGDVAPILELLAPHTWRQWPKSECEAGSA